MSLVGVEAGVLGGLDAPNPKAVFGGSVADGTGVEPEGLVPNEKGAFGADCAPLVEPNENVGLSVVADVGVPPKAFDGAGEDAAVVVCAPPKDVAAGLGVFDDTAGDIPKLKAGLGASIGFESLLPFTPNALPDAGAVADGNPELPPNAVKAEPLLPLEVSALGCGCEEPLGAPNSNLDRVFWVSG